MPSFTARVGRRGADIRKSAVTSSTAVQAEMGRKGRKWIIGELMREVHLPEQVPSARRHGESGQDRADLFDRTSRSKASPSSSKRMLTRENIWFRPVRQGHGCTGGDLLRRRER